MQGKVRLKIAAAVAVLIGGALGLVLISEPLIQSHTALGTDYSTFDTGLASRQFFGQELSQADLKPELTGTVTGILVDESDSPVRGIAVELMPVDKTGDERWYATKRDWTNAQGEYTFAGIEPGEYVLAMQKSGAPDGRHPFIGVYYPGVTDEVAADHISVAASSSLRLHPLRLRRINTATLDIRVQFEDGTLPAWSNLLFHNPQFPHQAVIGDEAPGIENGSGHMVLPVGFEYLAAAKVDCDGGTRIETRESRPIQRVRISNDRVPQELTFVIPGPVCPLWSPK